MVLLNNVKTWLAQDRNFTNKHRQKNDGAYRKYLFPQTMGITNQRSLSADRGLIVFVLLQIRIPLYFIVRDRE